MHRALHPDTLAETAFEAPVTTDGDELEVVDLVLRTEDGDVRFRNAGEANDHGCALSKVASAHLSAFAAGAHVTIYMARLRKKYVLTAFKPRKVTAAIAVEVPIGFSTWAGGGKAQA